MFQPDKYKLALLDAIAGGESGGNYGIAYGGKKLNDFSWHPGQSMATKIESGPNAGKTSSAAGKYQFLSDTWDYWAKQTGAKDFSPESQDMVAWALASRTYKQKTGRDLDTDIRSNNPAVIGNIGRNLSGQWTSLPGGIESTRDETKFVNDFQNSLSGGRNSYNFPDNNGSLSQFSTAPPSIGSIYNPQPYKTFDEKLQEVLAAKEKQRMPGPKGIFNGDLLSYARSQGIDATPERNVSKRPSFESAPLPMPADFMMVPGFGNMGHARAGHAGLANPGYADVNSQPIADLMPLMQLLLSDKLGRQEEFAPFMGG